MHVGIAHQEAEDRQLKQSDRVQPGHVGILAQGSPDLFHGAVVFLSSDFVQDLAEVLHVKLPVAIPVHSADDIGQLARFERDQPEFGRRDMA